MVNKVVIVGAGLIGGKRAESIIKLGKDRLVGFCDINKDSAQVLSDKFGGAVFTDWKTAIDKSDANIAIIATNHKLLPIMSRYALQKGLHVLCEKPLGRNAREVAPIVKIAHDKKLIYKCGFNHRYHPAIIKAKQMAESGKIGPLLYIRARYGHGGRPGYDKEWRANPDIAGGGELLDQGIHLIDLARWFLGDFTKVTGMLQTAYWNMKPLEDNGFTLLQTKKGQTAFLHASWTQWKNLFSFEVFGRDGYLAIEGLGKSYGVERLTWGKRRPESGPPILEEFIFEGEDISWIEEWKDFTGSIKKNSLPLGTGKDGLEALKIIDKIYKKMGIKDLK